MWKHLNIFDSRTTGMIPAALLVTALFTVAPHATAGIVVDGTRVIYPAAKREVTLNIRNPGATPSLVQVWLDSGDPHSKPGETKVPFVLTPPLFRLDPTKAQSLRLVFTHDPLPEDRESLFWLNVLDVPPRSATNPDLPNQLELAFKHRMKVFFRPAGLTGAAADAPAHLTWKLLSKDGKLVAIQASNPTGYHVSMTRIALTVAGLAVKATADMVAPFATHDFELPEPVTTPHGAVAVDYWFINDYGGDVNGTATASSGP